MLKILSNTLLTGTIIIFILGCQTKHQVETVHRVKVDPMHITIDINVKVDKALDEFFDELDAAEEEL